MSFVAGILIPFAVYWLILFAGCYVLVEYGQTYLYDETSPGAGAKVALGSFLLAAILTGTRTSYETMFTHEIGRTVIQAIVWFGVFTLVFRFHPWHAFGIALVAFVILAGASTLAVNSMTGVHPSGAAASREPSKPTRKSMAPTIPGLPKPDSQPTEAAKSEAPAKSP